MRVAIFDLDGTLVVHDAMTVAAARDALLEYFEAIGEPPVVPGPERIRALVGLPAEEYFAGLLPERHRADARRFMALAERHEVERLVRGEGRLLPGVPAAIDRLRSDGWRTGLVSNCLRPYLDANLEHVLERGWFDVALCLDDHPSKTANLAAALAALGGGPGVMIGDRSSDVESGRANGLLTVGCLYGYGTGEELREADATVASPEAIVPLLRGVRGEGG